MNSSASSGATNNTIVSGSGTCVTTPDHHDGVIMSKGDDGSKVVGDFGLFPREASDSGLLEEIVYKFMLTSKPKKCVSGPQELPNQNQTQVHQSQILSQSVTDATAFVSGSHQRYYETKKEGFGVCNYNLDEYQGLIPMQQQFDENGLVHLSNGGQMMLNHQQHADFSITQDLVRYQDILNAFSASIYNA